MKTINANEYVIGPVRLSYAALFKPKAKSQDDSTLEYAVVALIPKTAMLEEVKDGDTVTIPNKHLEQAKDEIKAIVNAIKKLATEQWGSNLKGFRSPLRDGDSKIDGKGNECEPKYPHFAFLKCAAKEDYPPMLMDGKRLTVTGGWESGDWAKVFVRFWSYDNKFGKGINAELIAVQFLYKDEPFGTRRDPEATAANFDEVEGADTGNAAAQGAANAAAQGAANAAAQGAANAAAQGAANADDDYDPFAEE